MSEAQRKDVTTADGRTLEMWVDGPTDGVPFVFHHGTPGAGLHLDAFTDAASTRGLRTVMYSRPGYGSSTSHPGRSVADAAADVAAILDALGADTFVTAGWSGGGPHALACSALLGPRCRAAVTIAGAAPADGDGLDFLDGMADENVEEFTLAMKGADALDEWMSAVGGIFAQVQGSDVAESLGGLLSEVDKRFLTDEFADYLAASIRTGLASGTAGWRDDDLAFVKPWGFDLDDVGRVAVWQGNEDRMVPFSHGQWLAKRIPGAESRLREDEGHLSIASGRFGEILDDLLSTTS